MHRAGLFLCTCYVLVRLVLCMLIVVDEKLLKSKMVNLASSHLVWYIGYTDHEYGAEIVYNMLIGGEEHCCDCWHSHR